MISNKTNRYMIEEVLEQFATQGINQLKASLEQLFNQLMLAEREEHVGAGPHERSDERRGYCNGFKNKKLLTRSGELELSIPQVREGGFYPSCLSIVKVFKNEDGSTGTLYLVTNDLESSADRI